MPATCRDDRGHTPALRCPWCREGCDTSGPWGQCPRDRTPFHYACLSEFGRCTSCGEALVVAALVAPSAPPAVRLVTRPTPTGVSDGVPRLVVSCGVAAVALMLGAGVPWAIGLGVVALVVLGRGPAIGSGVPVARVTATATQPPLSPVVTMSHATVPVPPSHVRVLPGPQAVPRPVLRTPAGQATPISPPMFRPPPPAARLTRLPPSALRPPVGPASVQSVPVDGACAMSGIGPRTLARLRAAGIRTLGDLTPRRLARVRGIGPVRSGQLLAWAAARRSGARAVS